MIRNPSRGMLVVRGNVEKQQHSDSNNILKNNDDIFTEMNKIYKAMSKLGDLRFPQGSNIVNNMEEDMTMCQKKAGENLSDTIKRGILMKALTNEVELQKHIFRNSTRLSTNEKMRGERQCTSRWETIVGKKGTGNKGKGKNGERAQAKRKAQEPRTPECFCCHKGHIKKECRIRVVDDDKDEKDKRKDKRFKQKEKKRANAMDGRGEANRQGEVQATVGALQARMIFRNVLMLDSECCAVSANR